MDLLKRITFIVFVLFILFLFVWAFFLPKKEATETVSEVLRTQKEKLDLFFQGVTFQENSNGVKYWELTAKTSSMNRDTGVADLKESRGTFFDNGKPALKFIAPRAIWDMNKQEIELFDPLGYDVKSQGNINRFLRAYKQKNGPSVFQLPTLFKKRGEGYLFKAQNLTWKLSTKKILCKEGIWLTKGEVTGIARELSADVALEKVILSGSPKIFISNHGLATIEAERFEVDSLHDIITAKDGVILTTDDIQLKANEAKYLQKYHLLQLKGGIVIEYKKALATASLANYHMDRQLIELTENTRLTRGESVLQGEKVLISLTDKQFRVVGKTKTIIPEKELLK